MVRNWTPPTANPQPNRINTMKELDYVLVTNRVKITTAKKLIADVLSGDDYGVTDGQRKTLLTILYSVETKLFGMIETDDGET